MFVTFARILLSTKKKSSMIHKKKLTYVHMSCHDKKTITYVSHDAKQNSRNYVASRK